VLADAGGADHRAQPPLGGLWRDLRDRHRFPRLRFRHPPDKGTIGTILKDNGYATSWFGKNHNTPVLMQYSQAGPFDQWPNGMGFEYFYGFIGGETSQWQPNLFRNHTRSIRSRATPAGT
jgi:arylsulfatase A-like enzyme